MKIYLLILLTLVTFTFIFFLFSISKSRRMEILYNNRSQMIQASVDDGLELLNKIIATTFNEYIILNVQYKNDYITQQLEQKINKDVCDEVLSKLSPFLIEKINLIYNENKIGEIIANTVYMHVLEYTIRKNDETNNEDEIDV